MEDQAQTDEDELASKRAIFREVVDGVVAISGTPFQRPGYGPTPLVELEGVMIGVAELFREGKQIGEPEDGWESDQALVDASTGGTNTRAMLRTRIERAKELLQA